MVNPEDKIEFEFENIDFDTRGCPKSSKLNDFLDLSSIFFVIN